VFFRSHTNEAACRFAGTHHAPHGSLSLYAPAAALAPAHAATWTVDTSARTEAQVRAAWAVLQPSYSGSAYAVAPSVVAPYAPGDAAAGIAPTA